VSAQASEASEIPSPSASALERGPPTLVDVVEVVAVDDGPGVVELVVVVMLVVVVVGLVDELLVDVEIDEELVVGTATEVVVELDVLVEDDVDTVELVVLVTLVLVAVAPVVEVTDVLLVDVADVLVVVTVDRQDAAATLVPMRVLTVSPRTRSMFERPPAFRWQ